MALQGREISSEVNGESVFIGNVTTAGLITEFPPIPVPAGFVAEGGSILSGPGGNLWFGYSIVSLKLKGFQSQSFLGRVTTSGAVTRFPISSLGPQSPTGISLAAGADGNLWFADGTGKDFNFGRMSPSGIVARFPVGKLSVGTVSTGPDGNLILAGENAKGRSEVFQVTTAGVFKRYKIPAAISDAFVVSLGPADGPLWFTDGLGPFQIGQITASGVARSHNLSHVVHTRSHFFDSMAAGQDGKLYILDGPTSSNTKVHRLSPGELHSTRRTGRPHSRR